MPIASGVKRSWQHRSPRPSLPTVAVLGGISATADASEWWPTVVCDGGSIDTSEYRVVGMDWLDGRAGPDGRPERVVTTHDQADALAAHLDASGIASLHAIVGASYGGMVALAFAERYPTRVEHVVVISAPAKAHPMSTALRSLQRRIVELGIETGRETDALSIARGLAMTTYRSTEEFGRRFDGESVERYLRHHGEKFARSFSAARFLALSLSADLHSVNPEECSTPATFVAARGDVIVPIAQMDELAARWGGPNRLIETTTTTGHDAFLAEPKVVGQLIHEALTSQVAS